MENMDESVSRELSGNFFDFSLLSLMTLWYVSCLFYFMLTVILLLSGDKQNDLELEFQRDTLSHTLSHRYDRLQELDPAAANRIHPNDHRKVRHTILLSHDSSYNIKLENHQFTCSSKLYGFDTKPCQEVWFVLIL